MRDRSAQTDRVPQRFQSTRLKTHNENAGDVQVFSVCQSLPSSSTTFVVVSSCLIRTFLVLFPSVRICTLSFFCPLTFSCTTVWRGFIWRTARRRKRPSLSGRGQVDLQETSAHEIFPRLSLVCCLPRRRSRRLARSICTTRQSESG